MCISAVTLAELIHGAEKSAQGAQPGAGGGFASRLVVLAYHDKAAAHYGDIRADLERRARRSVNDLHIAGHARSEGLVLVSNNVREFERVEDCGWRTG